MSVHSRSAVLSANCKTTRLSQQTLRTLRLNLPRRTGGMCCLIFPMSFYQSWLWLPFFGVRSICRMIWSAPPPPHPFTRSPTTASAPSPAPHSSEASGRAEALQRHLRLGGGAVLVLAAQVEQRHVGPRHLGPRSQGDPAVGTVGSRGLQLPGSDIGNCPDSLQWLDDVVAIIRISSTWLSPNHADTHSSRFRGACCDSCLTELAHLLVGHSDGTLGVYVKTLPLVEPLCWLSALGKPQKPTPKQPAS